MRRRNRITLRRRSRGRSGEPRESVPAVDERRVHFKRAPGDQPVGCRPVLHPIQLQWESGLCDPVH